MSFSNNNGANGPFKPMSEINVTPFVDVMLVLLVMFMVTAPMMVTGLDVDLPQASAQVIDNAENKLVLSLKSNKKIFLEESEVSLKRLKVVLKTNAKLKADKELLLEADKTLPYGFVAEVMGIIKEAGIANIGMVTEPSGGNSAQ